MFKKRLFKNFVFLGIVVVSSLASSMRADYTYMYGDYSYVVTTDANTLQIFDVTDPLSPVLLGSITTDPAPTSIYVQGMQNNVVVITSISTQIFDVTDPTNPIFVGAVLR